MRIFLFLFGIVMKNVILREYKTWRRGGLRRAEL